MKMSQIKDQNIRNSVKEAVKKIGRSASTGQYVTTKSYESKSYGDLTILTPSSPKKSK